MLASKTWKRSEVPAKRYSPSYNSNTNSSLPKLLLKHNGLILKNSYILYLFQISETARLKDMYVLFRGHFCQCDSQNARKYFNPRNFLGNSFSKNYICWFFISRFLRFWKSQDFFKAHCEVESLQCGLVQIRLQPVFCWFSTRGTNRLFVTPHEKIKK